MNMAQIEKDTSDTISSQEPVHQWRYYYYYFCILSQCVPAHDTTKRVVTKFWYLPWSKLAGKDDDVVHSVEMMRKLARVENMVSCESSLAKRSVRSVSVKYTL